MSRGAEARDIRLPKLKKSLKNPLTNQSTYDIINTEIKKGRSNMKVEMTKKNNVSRISDIKYGDTFIFGNNVFMKANVNEMDFECPECEAVVESYN